MKILPFDSRPGTYTIPLGQNVIKFTTKYNYRAEVWTMDILNIDDNPILSGLMLVPHVDLLSTYQTEAAYLGGIVVVEPEDQPGNYKSPEALGAGFWVIWYEPGETVKLQ